MIGRCCFPFVDYGVLLVTCFAYQECWSLETGHFLWLLVLKYRNMQLTSCDSHLPPVWTVWPVPPGGTVCPPVTRYPPSASSPCVAQLMKHKWSLFILPSLGNKFMYQSALLLCAVLLGEFHRIYALRQTESCCR